MFGTRKLGRTSDQRKAMLRQLTTDLLENGKLETTFCRAKEVQPVAEKMITLGKKGDLAAYRQALAFITKEDVAHKVFKELAPKYADRNGGYTRVTASVFAAATLPRWPSSSWCKRIPVYRCRMQDILQRFFYVRVSAINATSLCTVFHKTHCINC